MVSFDASLSAVLHDMWVEVFYVLSHLYREMAFMSCRGSTVDLWRKGAMLTPGGAKAGAKGRFISAGCYPTRRGYIGFRVFTAQADIACTEREAP